MSQSIRYTSRFRWVKLVEASVPEYQEAIAKNVEIFKSMMAKASP